MANDVPSSESAGQHVVILSHPAPGSFNHSIAKLYCDAVRWAGQEVVLRDLYAIGFDPVLKAVERPGPQYTHPLRDVADERELIRRSDIFVLIYPIWFGSAPAMMKGYVDRVLGGGVVPQAVVAGTPTNLLGNKPLLSFTTSATDGVWLEEQGQPSAWQTVFDRYLTHAFGMKGYNHLHFDHITRDLSEQSAGQHLQDVKDEAARACAAVTANRAAQVEESALPERVGR